MMDPINTRSRMEQIRASYPFAGKPTTVVMTARAPLGSAKVEVQTAPHLPDILVVPLTITRRLTVRTVRTYLQSLVGFLLAAGFTGAVAPGAAPVPLSTFTDVAVAASAAALVPACMSLLTNLLILFSGLDDSNPSIMG